MTVQIVWLNPQGRLLFVQDEHGVTPAALGAVLSGLQHLGVSLEAEGEGTDRVRVTCRERQQDRPAKQA